MSKRLAHYVLSTHWDREWYKPFQGFRWYLVRMIDRVLAGFQDGRLKGPFQTDGQAVVIEDYLEVRPERRELISQFARKGKIVIGPWYCMPDEFTISGESLIRNLKLGRKIARSLGARPSSSGFICDMFGHNSQLPQIFAGFDIRTSFLWRGTNISDCRNFIWRGADGTEIVCHRFGPIGYGTYAINVRSATKTEKPDAKTIAARFDEYLAIEAKKTDIDAVLLFDGLDHNYWDENAYVALLEKMASDENFEIVHTDLDAYSKEMLADADKIKTVLEGELREPGLASGKTIGTISETESLKAECQYIIPGVLSSRVPLKQQNRECETLLCNWAEPFASFACDSVGSEYPQGFLDVAWKWLLQNHPHDSIDGCSRDQVHRDMNYRFDQSRLIADRLAEQATSEIAAAVEGEITDKELRVVVFNPASRDVDRVVELELVIPDNWPNFNEFFHFEPKPSFRIYDCKSIEIPFQLLAQKMDQPNAKFFPNRLDFHRSNNVRVAVRLSMPAMGYTTLTVKSGEDNFDIVRHPDRSGLAINERSMANEMLEVTIEANGTLTLTDKTTGQTYNRLLTFEDSADIGDGWYHGQAVNEEVFVSTACQADVSLVHNGPMLTSFRIRNRMMIPTEFMFDRRMSRSSEFVELIIDNLISLRPGQDYVDITTRIDNPAGDHRLRVLLPSGAKAETYLADSQFDVVERPIALRSDNHLYRELEVDAKPQISWTAVSDKNRGLAVIADGLLETAVQDNSDRTIALTLFRSTRRTATTNGEPDGQLKTEMTFNYRIMPIAGAAPRTKLCELGQDISAGLRVLNMRRMDIDLHRDGSMAMNPVKAFLPAFAGFFKLIGPAVITSVQHVGNATEVRMFNPESVEVSVELDTSMRPAGVAQTTHYCLVDMENNQLCDSVKIGKTVNLKLEPKKIITIKIWS